MLVNVTGSSELTLDDVENAAGIVQQAANPNANIIFGATSSDSFQDEMRVTVIATGFDTSDKSQTEETASTEAKPEDAPKGDISDIDEIFKIFNSKS